MTIYTQLIDIDGREVFASRDCPRPIPYAIKYGDKFYVATGKPGWWARTFGPSPFRIYREVDLAVTYAVPIPPPIWDAGGPIE